MNSGSKKCGGELGQERDGCPRACQDGRTGPTQPDHSYPGHAIRGTWVSLPCVSPPTSALRQQCSFVNSSHHSCSEGPQSRRYRGWTVRPHPPGAYILMGESDGMEVNEQCQLSCAECHPRKQGRRERGRRCAQALGHGDGAPDSRRSQGRALRRA